jgi:hypothetical protein
MVVPVNVTVFMAVLGELSLVAVRMTAVINDDRQGKLVGLRNLLDRFPIGSTIRKAEVLALVASPMGLNRDGVGRYAGQPETRRNARLEDRYFECAFFRGDALQLRAMEGAPVCAMVSIAAFRRNSRRLGTFIVDGRDRSSSCSWGRPLSGRDRLLSSA